jgi:hypothetical protein
MMLAQPLGGGDQVGNVRREVGVGELAATRAEAGEVESQHRIALLGELPRDAPDRAEILAAAETVGEHRKREWRAGGKIEAGGQFGALAAGENDPLWSGAHSGDGISESNCDTSAP